MFKNLQVSRYFKLIAYICAAWKIIVDKYCNLEFCPPLTNTKWLSFPNMNRRNPNPGQANNYTSVNKADICNKYNRHHELCVCVSMLPNYFN